MRNHWNKGECTMESSANSLLSAMLRTDLFIIYYSARYVFSGPVLQQGSAQVAVRIRGGRFLLSKAIVYDEWSWSPICRLGSMAWAWVWTWKNLIGSQGADAARVLQSLFFTLRVSGKREKTGLT
jgi:hypothetical protein